MNRNNTLQKLIRKVLFIYFHPSCFKLLENRNVDLYLLRVSSFHRHYSMFACNTRLFVSDKVYRFTLQYTIYRFTGIYVAIKNHIINDIGKLKKRINTTRES